MINWIDINSSNIKAIAYQEVSQFLLIKFHKAGAYKYFNVPKNIFENLLQAESHGKYHAKFIKRNFRYEKIKEPY